MAARVRVGTCSFADEALVKTWYPKGVRSGEQRLRYYAERFDTCEIDSTYYRLPDAETVARWAERVPDGFVFHVKAFAPLTRHPVRLDVLPEELRGSVEANERGRVERMPREVRAEVFRRFREAVEPMRAAGKLGGILLQLAPYVVHREHSLEYLEWARKQLPGHDLLVEFRHRSWLDDDHRAGTLAFLEAHGLSLVVVDAPRTEAKNVIPTVVATTSPTAYVRFHGRNARTWNKRGGSAAERFDYLYSEAELAEWVEPMRELAGEAEQVYALMNTNSTSDGTAQGPENARRLAAALRDAGIDATG
ncbi:MAG TPA: DUF72 domain-containing protein [Gaiellaceae bacterium]|nr:DUF72 domain-containing protein [Gaiellaceae bacterium]